MTAAVSWCGKEAGEEERWCERHRKGDKTGKEDPRGRVCKPKIVVAKVPRSFLK